MKPRAGANTSPEATQPDLFAPVYSEERRVWWLLPRIVNDDGFFEDGPAREPHEGIRCDADFWYFPTYREFIHVGLHIHEACLSDGLDEEPRRKRPKGVFCSQRWIPGGVDSRCAHGAEGGGYVDEQEHAGYLARMAAKQAGPKRKRKARTTNG